MRARMFFGTIGAVTADGERYGESMVESLQRYADEGRVITRDFNPEHVVGRAVSVHRDGNDVYLEIEIDDPETADLVAAPAGTFSRARAGDAVELGADRLMAVSVIDRDKSDWRAT